MSNPLFCRRLFLCLAACLALAASVSAAPAVPGQFQFEDRAQLRAFEVAMDELHVVTPDHEHYKWSIAPQSSVEGVKQEARALQASSGNEVDLVLYEVGVARNEYTRRILTKQVLVKLDAGTDAEAVAQAAGGSAWKAVGEYHIFETAETGGALALIDALRQQPGVVSADPLLAKKMKKRLLPNDTLFPQQWHLRNTGQAGGTAGMDVNVTNVWDKFRGEGVKIAIIDDGLQHTHPDLQPNYDATISTNLNDHTADPAPNVSFDWHGTSCAGVAAARGTNAIGVVGAAFNATLSGIRLIGGAYTDADEAAAFNFRNDVIHIKSNSWGPDDDGLTVEGPGPLAAAAFAQGVQTGRNGKGIIYVWAGGNGLAEEDNANYDGYANSIYTIAVGAVSDQGNQTDYGEPGACLVVSAPSISAGRQGITTTDLLGNDGYNSSGAGSETSDRDYTQQFGGTSSATPLVAGVVALMLQANPNLGWRDVQEILIRSATKNQPADTDWKTNGAGFKFNHKFGAGLVNAGGAIALATNWVNLGGQSNVFGSASGLSIPIPDNDTNGITISFFATNLPNFRVEHAALTVSITHPFRGDLAITMTSPLGTQSRLAETHFDFGNNYSNWKFTTVRNWGESGVGTWTIRIADQLGLDTGTLTAIRVDLYGTIAPPADTANLSVSSVTVAPAPAIAGVNLSYNITVQNNGPTNATGVTLTDLLPTGVTYVSAVPSVGTATNAGTNVTWNIGSLASNATANIAITVVPGQTGATNLTNVVSVSGAQLDVSPENNTATTVTALLPQIFNVSTLARPSSAVINWSTLSNCTGQVEYGVTTGYGQTTPLNAALTANHSALLVGLIPGTNYYYRIIAQVGTNIVSAGPYTFSTNPNIIVDNPQATYSGSWTLGSSAPDKYGTYYQSAATTTGFSPSAQATYRPNLPVSALYDVSIWYPADANRTTNAQVTVFSDTDAVLRRVNQTVNGGQWNLLVSAMNFPAGTAGFGVIANNTGESGKVVMADAMRWSYNLAQDNPPNGGVPDWWSGYYFGTNVNTSLDHDGDGLSTYAEYVMGTDPTNATSQLQMWVSQSPPGLKITFTPAQGGRIYQLATTTNIAGGSWTLFPDAPVVSGSTGEFNVIPAAAAGPRFYRLAVRLAQ